VEAFLGDKIGFREIPEIIKKVMDEHEPLEIDGLEQVLTAHRWAREEAHRLMDK
jgi:1-deoxy-D-xylulose-5-phosphate reductoisomerase